MKISSKFANLFQIPEMRISEKHWAVLYDLQYDSAFPQLKPAEDNDSDSGNQYICVCLK